MSGPQDGHLWHLDVRCQGSSTVVGEPLRDETGVGPPWRLTVRAWDLRAAMREAGRVPLPAWAMDEDPDDPRHDLRQENP